MRKITNYEAKDGRVFSTEKECSDYEKIIEDVDNIMKLLPHKPEDPDSIFANGGGYIQHEKSVIDNAKIAITNYGNKLFKLTGKDQASFGWIGRIFDDSGNRPLYSAWGRLSHIDEQYREWGQGYFVANPSKGVQKPYIGK